MRKSLSGSTFAGSNNNKKSRQGTGTHSKPKKGKKAYRGQGRGWSLQTHSLIHMFVPSESTIILAVIGFIGLCSTALVVATAFKRNQTATFDTSIPWEDDVDIPF